MVRHMAIHVISDTFSPIPLAIGLFVSITLIVSLCAKHARQVRKSNYASKTSVDHQPNKRKLTPLPSPKQLIATISQKAMMHAKKPSEPDTKEDEENGLWQKAILMGDRCQPPEFSGVIYYDYSGNRIPEMPKSPRAGSMTPLRTLTFPVEKNDNSTY